jgi:hypothetical protein
MATLNKSPWEVLKMAKQNPTLPCPLCKTGVVSIVEATIVVLGGGVFVLRVHGGGEAVKLPDDIEREIRDIESEWRNDGDGVGGQQAGSPRLRGLRSAVEATVQEFDVRMKAALTVNEQRLDEIAAMKMVIFEYLTWGPMTGSDRDLFDEKFREVAGLPEEL